jgi:molybdopterin-biosynthesis enzyme MoeA-like protein
MQIEIVTIGNEVLSGRTLDTNFAFLARALEEASVPIGWHSTVGDVAERIAEALGRALARAVRCHVAKHPASRRKQAPR